MASVHRIKLKDGRLVTYTQVGTGLPVLLKDGTTVVHWLVDPVAITPGLGTSIP